MDVKYYTPTLEEFHVGFRYEELSWTDSNTWHGPYKWDGYIPTRVFEDLLDGGKIRVKYLDQADLEELGWYKLPELNIEWFGHPSGFHLGYSRPRPDEPPLIFIRENSNIRFSGDVRNYNELKVLMKQLNII